MNLWVAHDAAKIAPPTGSRCAHCAVRSASPCGGIDGAAGLADLERSHARPRHVAADQTIFEQGAASDMSYTVLRGWVALTHVAADGRLSIVRFVLPGEVLSFDRNSRINAVSAVAVGDAIICGLARPRQARLEADYPEFNARHRAAEADALEQAYAALSCSLSHSAMERVSGLLLQLAWRSLKRRPRRGDRIFAPLRQTQIGLATGLTAVHVSRVMRRLREDGIARLESQALSLFDPVALEQRACSSIADMAVQT